MRSMDQKKLKNKICKKKKKYANIRQIGWVKMRKFE